MFRERIRQIEALGYRHEIVTVERWRHRNGSILLREAVLAATDEEFIRYLEIQNDAPPSKS